MRNTRLRVLGVARIGAEVVVSGQAYLSDEPRRRRVGERLEILHQVHLIEVAGALADVGLWWVSYPVR